MSRKFRWLLSGNFPSYKISPMFVSLQSRPVWDTENKQVKNNGEFTTTLMDFKHDDTPELFAMMAAFFNFGGKIFGEEGVMLSEVATMLGTLKLELQVPGCEKCPHCQQLLMNKIFMGGGPLETIEEWNFTECWPHAVNFGELCYSSNEEVDLEITWKYRTGEYVHKSMNLGE